MMRTNFDPIEGRTPPEKDGGAPLGLQYASDTSGEAVEDLFKFETHASTSYNPPAIIPRGLKGRQRSLTADAPTTHTGSIFDPVFTSTDRPYSSGTLGVRASQAATPASLPAGVGRQDAHESPMSNPFATYSALSRGYHIDNDPMGLDIRSRLDDDNSASIFRDAEYSPPGMASATTIRETQRRSSYTTYGGLATNSIPPASGRIHGADGLTLQTPDSSRPVRNYTDNRAMYDQGSIKVESPTLSQGRQGPRGNLFFDTVHPRDSMPYGNVAAVHLPTPGRPPTSNPYDRYDSYDAMGQGSNVSPTMHVSRNIHRAYHLAPQQPMSPPPGLPLRGPRVPSQIIYGTQLGFDGGFNPTTEMQNMAYMANIDPIINIENGVSVNYQGNAALERNHSERIPEDLNCSFWITGLAPDTTHHELLATIRNTGRVYALVINRPVGTHQTSAAKIIFFDLDAAQSFHARTVREGFVVRGYQGHVSKNRIRTSPKDQEGQRERSRVLLIKGNPEYVNPNFLTKLFAGKFKFEIDEVVVRELNEHISHIEYRFGSYRCQAEAGYQVLKRELLRNEANPNGPVWNLRWGRDPCDVFKAAFGTSQWFEHVPPAQF